MLYSTQLYSIESAADATKKSYKPQVCIHTFSVQGQKICTVPNTND